MRKHYEHLGLVKTGKRIEYEYDHGIPFFATVITWVGIAICVALVVGLFALMVS